MIVHTRTLFLLGKRKLTLTRGKDANDGDGDGEGAETIAIVKQWQQ